MFQELFLLKEKGLPRTPSTLSICLKQFLNNSFNTTMSFSFQVGRNSFVNVFLSRKNILIAAYSILSLHFPEEEMKTYDCSLFLQLS